MFSVRTLKKGLPAGRQGFTLVELMIVIAVIAILATIGFFGLGKAQAAARDTQRQQTMNSIRATIERYFGDKQMYPKTPGATTTWAGSTTDSPIGILTNGGYLSAAPTDPCPPGSATISNTGTVTGCSTVKYEYTPAPTNCDNATTTCTSYTLTLTKEGGGTSTFSSPQ